MKSQIVWISCNFFRFLILPLTVSNSWRNTTRRWRKVCVIKQQLYKSPWEPAYYWSETCRRYLTKVIYQLSWNEYNKAWLNTNWPKHRIYLPYSSRNCFESFEYSEKRIASIHKNFLPSPQGAHTMCLCSRLLLYSKCTGFTVCFTYSDISLTMYINQW